MKSYTYYSMLAMCGSYGIVHHDYMGESYLMDASLELVEAKVEEVAVPVKARRSLLTIILAILPFKRF